MAASTNLTAAERSARARLAALTLHAGVADPTAYTAPARAAGPGALSYWERVVDPDGTLDDASRARRAEFAKRAHYQRLAYKSARARRRRRGANG